MKEKNSSASKMNDMLISRGENERLEFKASLRLKEEIGHAVSAFSNANGGSILIGVSDAGTFIGVEIGRNTLEKLANYTSIVAIEETETKFISGLDIKKSQNPSTKSQINSKS